MVIKRIGVPGRRIPLLFLASWRTSHGRMKIKRPIINTAKTSSIKRPDERTTPEFCLEGAKLSDLPTLFSN
jgi:hypothetical protein